MNKEKRTVFSKLVSYATACISALTFALYCSGRVGWFFLLVLLLTPCLSILFSFIFVKMLSVSAVYNDFLLAKGQKPILQVSLFNPIPFPSPRIQCLLEIEEQLMPNHTPVTLSLGPRENRLVEMEYSANLCGATSLGVEGLYVWDYLGLVRFPYKKEIRGNVPSQAEEIKKNGKLISWDRYRQLVALEEMDRKAAAGEDGFDIDDSILFSFSKNRKAKKEEKEKQREEKKRIRSEKYLRPWIVKVGILPDFADVGKHEELLLAPMQASMGTEDDESPSLGTSHTFGGFPGYDYREYEPGDPIRRINYKLSAGRGQLYVRLDERTSVSEMTVILSPLAEIRSRSDLTVCADALETFLGVVNWLLIREFSVAAYLCSEQGWVKWELKEEGDLGPFRDALAMISFEEDPANLEGGLVIPDTGMMPGEAGGAILVAPSVRGTAGLVVEELDKRGFTALSIYDISKNMQKEGTV